MSEAKKVEEMARKIWLAGLGAYGQGFDNIEQNYEKMNAQTRKMFDELVLRGEHLEKGMKTSAKKLRAKGEKLTAKQATKLSSRLNQLGSKVTAPELVNEQIKDIRARLNDLSAAIGQALAAGNARAKASTTASKKPKAVQQTAAPKTPTRSAAPKATPKRAAAKTAGAREKDGAATPLGARKAAVKKTAPKTRKDSKKTLEQPE